ncbi:Transposase IS3/IS911family [Spirosomataceae bacterium]
MAKITKDFSMTVKERRYRRFSESFKREKVKEIIENRSTVSDICRVNEVSYIAVYHWINLYSNTNKPHRTIVEAKSDTTKILALQKKIADLERLIGQKQVQIDFQEKMIEIAEETYQVDIKKKFGTKP